MRVGILGGTFNPIHNGHVDIAYKIYKYFSLDRVLFMVNKIPPHKDSHYILGSDIRINLVNIAIKGYDYFNSEDYEINKEGISYTYESLEYLKSIYFESDLFFIVGSDSFVNFNKWKNIGHIFKNAVIIVYLRENSHKDIVIKLKEYYIDIYNGRIEIFDGGIIDISSTRIRYMINNGEDISGLVNKDVYNYIIKNHLYRG